MGLINDSFSWIDGEIVSYVSDVFDALADPLELVLVVAGTLGLILVAINSIFQFRTIQFSAYSDWFFRYILVFCFALFYSNFELLYTLIVQIPVLYSVALLEAAFVDINSLGNADYFDSSKVSCSGTNCNVIWAAMDEFANAMFAVAQNLIDQFSMMDMNLDAVFLGVVVYIMAAIFVCASVIIVIVAYVGLAMMAGFAPLAISLLLFQQTKNYFEKWLTLMVSFAIVPLLIAALMSVVISMGVSQLPGYSATVTHTFSSLSLRSKSVKLNKEHWVPTPRPLVGEVNFQYPQLPQPLLSASLDNKSAFKHLFESNAKEKIEQSSSASNNIELAIIHDSIGDQVDCTFKGDCDDYVEYLEDKGVLGSGDNIPIGDFLKFLVICLASIIILFAIPTIGHTLAGASIGMGAAAMAYVAAKSAGRKMRNGVNRAREGHAAYKEATKSGLSGQARRNAAIGGMMLSAGSRKHQRDQRKMDMTKPKSERGGNSTAHNSSLPESQQSAAAQNRNNPLNTSARSEPAYTTANKSKSESNGGSSDSGNSTGSNRPRPPSESELQNEIKRRKNINKS